MDKRDARRIPRLASIIMGRKKSLELYVGDGSQLLLHRLILMIQKLLRHLLVVYLSIIIELLCMWVASSWKLFEANSLRTSTRLMTYCRTQDLKMRSFWSLLWHVPDHQREAATTTGLLQGEIRAASVIVSRWPAKILKKTIIWNCFQQVEENYLKCIMCPMSLCNNKSTRLKVHLLLGVRKNSWWENKSPEL